MCAMSPTVRRPSHSSRIAAPVSLSINTPSGYCRTCCRRTGSNSSRASRQSVGTDSLDRGTSRLQVRVVNRVDHGPQDFQLELERLERPALQVDARTVREDELEPLLAVARRLNQPT